VKLSPNVADVKPFVIAAEQSGADAVSLINTLRAMEISLKTQRPILGNRSGGLSGPAIRPVALYQVYQASSVAQNPVVGMGGIETADDVIRFLLAGATAVQVGTALFRNPGCATQMVEGLERYLADLGDTTVENLIGAAHGDK